MRHFHYFAQIAASAAAVTDSSAGSSTKKKLVELRQTYIILLVWSLGVSLSRVELVHLVELIEFVILIAVLHRVELLNKYS